ncbi:MAG: hypothetical protein OXH00_02725 [Candidatus Poribacteria bacterium]|nr:hypothetical protein [Candidatus Poribacteria bacterium]
MKKETWDELQQTILMGGTLLLALIYVFAVIYIKPFADSQVSGQIWEFLKYILLMVFTHCFTKSGIGGGKSNGQ